METFSSSLYKVGMRYKQAFLALITGISSFMVLVILLHVPWYVESQLSLGSGHVTSLPPRNWFYIIGGVILIPITSLGCRVPLEMLKSNRSIEDKHLQRHAREALLSMLILAAFSILVNAWICMMYPSGDHPQVVISATVDTLVSTLIAAGLAFGFITALHSNVQLYYFFSAELPETLLVQGRKALIQLFLMCIIGIAGAALMLAILLSPQGFYTFNFFSFYGLMATWVLEIVFCLRSTWYLWKVFESTYLIEQANLSEPAV